MAPAQRYERNFCPRPRESRPGLWRSREKLRSYRGMGANMALLDADSLRRALLRVYRGQSELIPALQGYEAEMIDRGFRAVEASLKQMKQVHSQGRFANAMRGFSLRTIERFPVHLKWAIMQRR